MSWTVPMMMKENGYEYTMWLEEVDVKLNAVECNHRARCTSFCCSCNNCYNIKMIVYPPCMHTSGKHILYSTNILILLLIIVAVM